MNGVLRAFPGHAWTEYDATAKELNGGLGSPTQNVDITPDSDYAPYDHRLTPWFAKAVSGAKDVVIIIDLSQNIGK